MFKSLNKGAIQTWFPTIVGIIIVLLIGGGILAWQYYKAPKEEVKAPEEEVKEGVEDETADWKIYRNEEYGFEVKYPSGLTAKDWAHKTPNWSLLVYIGENKDIGDGAVSVGIEKGVSTLEQKSFFPFAVQVKDLEDVLIGKDNYKAKKFSYKGPAHEMPEETDFVTYFIEHSDYLYQIHYDKLGGLEQHIFNQMLSTFRFLK